MMETNQEYVSSVTLMVLGTNLDPDMVSEELNLNPSQSWRNGEQKSFNRPDGSKHVFDSKHEWGGWRLFSDPLCKNAHLETQLQFWCDALQDKTSAMAVLKSKGLHCVLDVFVTTDATASIVLPEELQRSLGTLGLEIEISIIAGNKSEHADSLRRPKGRS
jgi:hypothetical protein